jgi:hypothetical protein
MLPPNKQVTGPHTAQIFFSFGLGLILLFALAGSISFWNADGVELFGAARYSLICAALPIVFALYMGGRRAIKLDPRGFALILPVLYCIDWLPKSYSLIQGPHIRGELLIAFLLALFLIRDHKLGWVRLFAIFSIMALSTTFLVEAQGRTLTSDDHPSFLYRLWLLKEQFPFIPFYYPGWNAGIDQRDFFATGALNVFLLFAPFIYAFPLEHSYTILISLVLFLLPSVSFYIAARILHFRVSTALFASLLGLCSSLLWYRWGLKYGTMGFIASASLVPLNLALFQRIISKPQDTSRALYLLSICTCTLMLLWSPSGLIFIPCAAFALFNLRSLLRSPKFLVYAASLLAINLSWLLIFVSVSKVGNFIQVYKPSYDSMAEEQEKKTGKPHIEVAPTTLAEFGRASQKILRQTSVSANPLLILLCLPGLALLRGIRRNFWSAHFAWLLMLGTLVALFKPQLELDRMLVVLCFVSALPCAKALEQLLALSKRSPISKIASASALSFVLVSPLATGSLLRNRSFDHFHFSNPRTAELRSLITQHAGLGRAVFTGFVLHDFAHGHLAPLPLLTGVPIVASSPFHDQWTYKELFPKSVVDAGDAAIEALLDDYNATLVVAHEERWVDYFRSRRPQYQVLGEARPFTVFKRMNYQPTYFRSGAGLIESQDNSSVTLRLDTVDADLKFSYFPFLRSTACTLTPIPSATGKNMIGLRGCPLNIPIKIESCGTWCRVFSTGNTP